MVIKNSDGSIYKLNGPNPVMKEQKTWNGFILHNMDWNPYIFGNEEKPVQSTPVQEYKDTFLEELEKTQPENPKQENVTTEAPKNEKPQTVKDNLNKPKLNIPTTLCYCLPAKEESKTDFLYDEVYKSVSYDQPFVLEIVITEETDVTFECWTTIDKVDLGSILYPKNKMKRWWKVSKKEPKTGGFLLKGVISQYQPSFED